MTSKELCIELMKADTEDRVLNILEREGYWGKDDLWRYYGGFKNNYSQAGNQTSDPEPALVEKIVNSVDARLMGECQAKGVDPRGNDAPETIREAVAEFFEENPDKNTAGLVEEWSPLKRREVARGITLATTGYKASEGDPSITIADKGEGQTPNRMPQTLLSLKEEIKMEIPFVQGRFDQGGTAALRFCGDRNLQLVLSKRDPRIVEPEDNSADNTRC